MLIPYHTARLFDSYEPFYVKNGQTSTALTLLRTILDPWGMPLLFVVAGAGACFALQRRTGRQYLHDRVLRLIVPLLFGLLFIVPPQAYYAWLSNGHQSSYLHPDSGVLALHLLSRKEMDRGGRAGG